MRLCSRNAGLDRVLLFEAPPREAGHAGGGRWRLAVSRRARKWIGKRVRVVGRRVEFDLIEVDSISAADAA